MKHTMVEPFFKIGPAHAGRRAVFSVSGTSGFSVFASQSSGSWAGTTFAIVRVDGAGGAGAEARAPEVSVSSPAASVSAEEVAGWTSWALVAGGDAASDSGTVRLTVMEAE